MQVGQIDGEYIPTATARQVAERWNEDDNPTMVQIAKEYGVKAQTVQRHLYNAEKAGILTRALPGADYRKNRMKYNTMNRGRILSIKRLTKAMLKVLDEREVDILTERRMKAVPMSLKALGERYGVTLEAIRLIEKGAIEKIEALKKDD